MVQAILKRDEAAAGLAVKRARWREREAGVQEEARLRLGTMEVRKRPGWMGLPIILLCSHFDNLTAGLFVCVLCMPSQT